MGDELLTSIDQYGEFHVNLLFDRYVYRMMCTHMGYDISSIYPTLVVNIIATN